MVKETKLYELLEISPNADEQEIRKSYKLLALKYHPDKQSLSENTAMRENATNIFKNITEAYEILSDKDKRYLYDNYGEEIARNPQGQTNDFSTNNHQYDHNQYDSAQPQETYQHYSHYEHHSYHHNQHPHAQNQHQHQHQQSQFIDPLKNNLNFNYADPDTAHFQNSSEMFNQFFSDFTSSNFMNNFNTPFSSFANNMRRSYGEFGDSPATTNPNIRVEKHENPVINDDAFIPVSNNDTDKNDINQLRKGCDILDNVSCSLLDYYNGKEVKMSLIRRVKCSKCHCKGGFKIFTCNDCCGNGYIIHETISNLNNHVQRIQSTCTRCNGTGEIIPRKYVCDECGGNKLVDKKVILDFRTPRGVSEGYRIVFANAADEGINLIPGDVILTLKDDKFKNSNLNFKRFGSNLLTTVVIKLVDVLCGNYIEFKHINGETVTICISRGDIKFSNQLKILKGYGMPIHEKSKTKKTSKGTKNSKKSGSSISKKLKIIEQLNQTNDVEKVDNSDIIYNEEEDEDDQNPGVEIIPPNFIDGVLSNKTSTVGTSVISESSSESSSSSGHSSSCKYGDLIIKFEIELPDSTHLTRQNVDMLSKLLGSDNKRLLTESKLGTVSSSGSGSSDENNEFSAEDDSNSNLASLNMKNFSSTTPSTTFASNSSNSSTKPLGKNGEKIIPNNISSGLSSTNASVALMDSNNDSSGGGSCTTTDSSTSNVDNVMKSKNTGFQAASRGKFTIPTMSKLKNDPTMPLASTNNVKVDESDVSVEAMKYDSSSSSSTKVEYLQDLTNIDKMGLTYYDFPLPIKHDDVEIKSKLSGISAGDEEQEQDHSSKVDDFSKVDSDNKYSGTKDTRGGKRVGTDGSNHPKKSRIV